MNLANILVDICLFKRAGVTPAHNRPEYVTRKVRILRVTQQGAAWI